MAKYKLFNDPIYGLINFQYEILYKVIDSAVFQRLRRISQMGLSSYVYPGANHTRFQHALGALWLTDAAMNVLEYKGTTISKEEKIATNLAILCHDIGHGPFSHALEGILIRPHHEAISIQIMRLLAVEHDFDFDLAIAIMEGTYDKVFLHQLISSQLDMDRMDYLSRDSFYSGVAEGVIGYDRIIKMLAVVDNQLVLEEKGIYSVEKFFMARHLMYWQVYLHKTSLAAEMMLISIVRRIRFLVGKGSTVLGSKKFIQLLLQEEESLDLFLSLDDTDVFMTIKENCEADDVILKFLCNSIVKRQLYHVILQIEPINQNLILNAKKSILDKFGVSQEDLGYFVFEGNVGNKMYDDTEDVLMVITKSEGLKTASELLPTLKRPNWVNKNYFIYARH